MPNTHSRNMGGKKIVILVLSLIVMSDFATNYTFFGHSCESYVTTKVKRSKTHSFIIIMDVREHVCIF